MFPPRPSTTTTRSWGPTAEISPPPPPDLPVEPLLPTPPQIPEPPSPLPSPTPFAPRQLLKRGVTDVALRTEFSVKHVSLPLFPTSTTPS
ncbi:unnamed protein product [Spirodela intermedia]|uniref:Uncharacterized protein n=1 Tax=Spirodela intermedia TaxID=51605 RepID=A0A7I8JAH8_SPIIN|nr:unnamed protein product [Spirodela intermedia]CAA6667001.1 unnamed protein product [Spirodela intermedia]